MAEIIRTNDVAAIAAVEGLLIEADLEYFVADRDMSVIDGSIGAIQMRVLVVDEQAAEARQVLTDAGLGRLLR